MGIQTNKGKRKKADAITEKILDEPALDNETIFANFQVNQLRPQPKTNFDQ